MKLTLTKAFTIIKMLKLLFLSKKEMSKRKIGLKNKLKMMKQQMC